MNCMEFRRISLEDPQHMGDEADQHLEQCTACHTYYRGLLQQERLLEKAFAIEVPDDLAARVTLRQRLEEQGDSAVTMLPTRDNVVAPVKWRKWATGFALAASIVAVTLGINLRTQGNPAQIAQMLVDHVEHEAYTLQLQDAVTQGRLAYTLNNVDIETLAHLGGVTFAGNCLIEGQLAAHLVVQTESGPVTILMMPNSELRPFDYSSADATRVQTVALERGSLALIGPEAVDLDRVRERVISSVRVLRI
ncbi:DUF3379 domain-containing protein [Aestuariirhabdus sp. Z084]|uniref:DUF3379 family protein n=1 Tax=Aestuariirhabdus haliotis TaxID=2918751 RepID=UPI00201B3B2E|nr:DUF3379 family protein [Aestuariirhabdus haliotis]MCL6417478.1 DUF3379 domain-containing protein [Aestuariirhabdus haliotis]MCL6421436.1 DUF3379 domain-containing protein [Aestuariirhabdus haliotis]